MKLKKICIYISTKYNFLPSISKFHLLNAFIFDIESNYMKWIAKWMKPKWCFDKQHITMEKHLECFESKTYQMGNRLVK